MLTVKKAGFFTSVQDSGRPGYRHLGVPISGFSDRLAGTRVNSLLENDPSDAVLECTMKGPVLEFSEPTYIAMSGADMEAELNGEPVEMNRVYQVPADSTLECGHTSNGLRTYMGIKGGIDGKKIMGSRSYFYPVTDHRAVSDFAKLAYAPCSDFEPKILKLSSLDLHREEVLECRPGPEYAHFEEGYREVLFGRNFTLSKEYDRMACQLQETVQPHSYSMITSATLPGTVQLSAAGRLIVLMRDGQTTGGYPRVLQLEERAINILAQKHFGEHIRFQLS